MENTLWRDGIIIIINNLLHQNDVHMGRENMKMKRNEIVQRGGEQKVGV